MVVAAAGSIIFNTNLPISVSLVWITNPITMPFLFTLAYKVGAYFLNVNMRDVKIEPTFDSFSYIVSDIFPTILFGCLFIGFTGSMVGLLFIRLLWRMSILNKWKKRKKK